jgi:hypothetical protein
VLEIGAELTRRSGDGPAAIRVVGVMGNAYVAHALPWGSNALYSPQQMMLLYGALDPEISVLSEHDAYLRMSQTPYKAASAAARAAAKLAERERADEPTAEQVFARAEASSATREAVAAADRKLRRRA